MATLQKIEELERPPVHPGEFLREDFMPDYDLTVAAFADAISVSRQSINEILRERRAVSPAMALRFAKFFGNSPQFWLNAQDAYDLWDAARRHRQVLAAIRPIHIKEQAQRH